MTRPKLLDLFSCAGGAGMGYYRAGFDVYAVDIDPQPNNPFPFHQGDALEVLCLLILGGAVDFTHRDGTVEWLVLEDFTAAHGSPPCQGYSATHRLHGKEWPKLIAPTRQLLDQTQLPWVIENVVDARPELIEPVTLCGAMFPGLHTYRHRLFETGGGLELMMPPHPNHTHTTVKMGRPLQEGDWYHAVGNFSNVAYVRRDMDVPWMNRHEIAESLPPAYTQHIGAQLLERVRLELAA